MISDYSTAQRPGLDLMNFCVKYIINFLLCCLSLLTVYVAVGDDRVGALRFGKPVKVGVLSDDDIRESSGLARSLSLPGAFWTHNDSGDDPRLYLIDGEGRTLTTADVRGAEAVDWEDICSFRRAGTNYLLVGDIGGNAVSRKTRVLYLIKEPSIDSKHVDELRKLEVDQTIPFKFDGEQPDCESLAFDPLSEAILLTSKPIGLTCQVYQLALPVKSETEPLLAKPIATLRIAAPTAMDVSSNSKQAVICTYLGVYLFEREGDESWSDAFGQTPTWISLPLRKQGESVCFGADCKSILLTSEGKKQPLWKVPAE